MGLTSFFLFHFMVVHGKTLEVFEEDNTGCPQIRTEIKRT